MNVTNAVFPNLTLTKLNKTSEAVLKFIPILNEPISKLQLLSNCQYDLYVNGKFHADGGLRCASCNILMDEFNFEPTYDIYVLLHYISFNNSVWHRMIFNDPFIASTTPEIKWKCYLYNSISFGCKISSQLTCQNIIESETTSDVSIPIESVKFERLWKFTNPNIHFNYHRTLFNSNDLTGFKLQRVFPKFRQNMFIHSSKDKTSYTDISDIENMEFKPKKNLMDLLHKVIDVRAICYTIDLQLVSLHKIFVKTTNRPLIVYYSEVTPFEIAWNTQNRNKVWMADAFYPTQSGNATHAEWRGCRYLHILTCQDCQFEIETIRKEYNFNWLPLTFKEQQIQTIIDACKNNLRACIDGGVVDTCWRERAQWVGDAYISTKALKCLCSSDCAQPIIDNVIEQIKHSYDYENGMVQGAYPIKNEKRLNFYMPTYHLLWCLTVLEHKKTDCYEIVKHSLNKWEEKYINSEINLLDNLKGWSFVDWADNSTGRNDKGDITNSNAICNIIYRYLCQQFEVKTVVSKKSINSYFLNKRENMYSLYHKSECPPSIHATSIAIIYLNANDKINTSFAEYLFNSKSGKMPEHTMYFGYFIAKALMFNKELQQKYIIDKYYEYAKQYGSIIEKIEPESSMAHGWSIGIVEFLVK